MTQQTAVQMTPKAVEMGKKKLANGPAGTLGLRVGVKGGGCSGYSYVYDFATSVRDEKDVVFEFDGLRLIIDKKSLEFLQGATLDWEQKLVSYGFKWNNPNAKDGCGCGTSFNT